MSYHLEYVDKADRFDEVVEQDGVKVIIDSKALFSIIGSTMDWQEDALQAKFVFNSKLTNTRTLFFGLCRLMSSSLRKPAEAAPHRRLEPKIQSDQLT